MADLMIDRSPQFELKLLTNISISYTQRFRMIPFLTVGVRKRYAFRIQPDCQTSAHPIHDLAKVDYMPASKAVRLQSNKPQTKLQPVTGRFYYNQKIWESERTSSEKGAIGTSVGRNSPQKSSLYRVLLPTLP
jgi:hypothetical protein